MKRFSLGALLVAIILSLAGGIISGFFIGVASVQAGKEFLDDLVEDEEKADVDRPQRLVREKFQLQYPSNWKVDVNDADYDPDQMFSIESPGSTIAMFVMGKLETEPEENLQDQISEFRKIMDAPKIERFEKLGRFSGKGATLRGKIFGIRSTVKAFSFYQNELTVMITEQYPDEDLKYVQDGLTLIEDSFSLINK